MIIDWELLYNKHLESKKRGEVEVDCGNVYEFKKESEDNMEDIKVGDKVRFRSDLKLQDFLNNPHLVSEEMLLQFYGIDDLKSYIGRVEDDDGFTILVNFNGLEKLYPRHFFEKVEEEHKFEFGLDLDYVGEKLEWCEGRRIEAELRQKTKELLKEFGKKTKEIR